MSIQEVEKMSNKGSWIPITAEYLEDAEEDDVTNGEYYIQFYYGNYPVIANKTILSVTLLKLMIVLKLSPCRSRRSRPTNRCKPERDSIRDSYQNRSGTNRNITMCSYKCRLIINN
jgi:hypothetical protein